MSFSPKSKLASAYPDLPRLIRAALEEGEVARVELEQYLTERSKLPGPRMDTALVKAFAEYIGELVQQPDLAVERLEKLLDGWAALSLEDAPVNQPREILPAVAVRCYGQVAVARPDWWEDEVAKLMQAATSPRWRTREIVATALQHMLAADWERTCALLQSWLLMEQALVIRAAAAAIAEPPLLKSVAQGEQALAIQKAAVAWLEAVPPVQRQDEAIKILRQTLGYTLSVAVAAAPKPGFALLEKLAASEDKDVQWILRENLKKKRLSLQPDARFRALAQED